MYLLGIDIGSSSVKVALVEAQKGVCVASAFYPKQEAAILSVKLGWAEQHPESWWNYLKESVADVCSQTRISPSDIKAIGISYQMHGLVLVDKNKQVLRPSIIWCDSRAVPYGNKAFEHIGSEKCLSHLLNSPGNFTAAKLAWVKENEPDIFSITDKFMLPGEYIAMKLTGEICTTPSGISEGIAWDFIQNTLSQDILKEFGFSSTIFPEIKPTFSIQGLLTATAAQELGLVSGIPISYRAGDQPNNALSLNVFQPGEVAATAGTSGVVYGISDKVQYDKRSRVNSFVHVNHTSKQTRIGVMLCINGTGILNAWLRKQIMNGISYHEINQLAATVAIGSDGLCVLPYGNGAERVLENKEIQAGFHGLSFNLHTQAHLARAAQEGIVFTFKYGMDIMQQVGITTKVIRAGKANMFLSPVFTQTLANICETSIELYDTDGAIGAAKGAGIGAGIYKNEQEAFASLQKIETIDPKKTEIAATKAAYLSWENILKKQINE
ncbi:MAG: carbohydrate kinase [Paludibacteraceae bacterium]|nr:carbohydrate kinase [Paludibacteraceae bacterium]MBN2786846.1 carbohydrate kinase [Paludibacteraceae bacterium]